MDDMAAEAEEAESEDSETEQSVDTVKKDNNLSVEQSGEKSEENVSEDDVVQNESIDDRMETETSNVSHTPSLEGYSAQETEYARVLLMTGMVDSASSIIYISHYPAGSPVADGYEDSIKFLDPTTVIMGEYGYSGSITYASHGDGNITIYPMPSHWHQEDKSPEGYRTYAQEILDEAETVYVEPGNNRDIINIIDSVIFDYYD
ncbi:hypothetical protein [Alkalibacterium putridalgicola]|nr:hypothetical protein [Alkalibacterium putridalgicola]